MRLPQRREVLSQRLVAAEQFERETRRVLWGSASSDQLRIVVLEMLRQFADDLAFPRGRQAKASETRAHVTSPIRHVRLR